jgi:hypothetical protein
MGQAACASPPWWEALPRGGSRDEVGAVLMSRVLEASPSIVAAPPWSAPGPFLAGVARGMSQQGVDCRELRLGPAVGGCPGSAWLPLVRAVQGLAGGPEHWPAGMVDRAGFRLALLAAWVRVESEAGPRLCLVLHGADLLEPADRLDLLWAWSQARGERGDRARSALVLVGGAEGAWWRALRPTGALSLELIAPGEPLLLGDVDSEAAAATLVGSLGPMPHARMGALVELSGGVPGFLHAVGHRAGRMGGGIGGGEVVALSAFSGVLGDVLGVLDSFQPHPALRRRWGELVQGRRSWCTDTDLPLARRGLLRRHGDQVGLRAPLLAKLAM